jgi:hypothetical protein
MRVKIARGEMSRLFIRRSLSLLILFFLAEHCLVAGALVQGYLVRMRQNSSPRSPGGRIRVESLKKAGIRNLSVLKNYLGKNLGHSNTLYGPRSANSSRIKSLEEFWFISAARIVCSRRVADELSRLPKVLEVVPEELISLSLAQSQIQSRPSRWSRGLDLPLIHAAGHKGEGIRVGIIDTGILSHPIFEDRIERYKDFSSQPIQEPQDPEGHGTHVAGILAGRASDDGETGVAPGARLIVARVLERVSNQGSPIEVSSRVQGLASRVLAAMQWMLDPDGNPKTQDYPKIINNSWGFPVDHPLSSKFFSAALRRWRDLGVIALFAAGNEGRRGEATIRFPGDSTEVITIAALKGQERANFSSQGSASLLKPDFAAPGFRIFSLKVFQGQPVFGYLSGTSMATAALSGLVALMVQIDPFITYDEVYQILKDSSKDLGNQGFDFETGWGAPDFQRALHLTRKLLLSKASLLKDEGLRYFLEFSRQLEHQSDSWTRKALVQIELSFMESLEKTYRSQSLQNTLDIMQRLDAFSQKHTRIFLPLKWRMEKRLRFLKHDK